MSSLIHTANNLFSSNVTPAQKFNTTSNSKKTGNGAPSYLVSDLQELKRTVLSCMLWEDSYYEGGQTTAQRIANLIPKIEPSEVVRLAYEARTVMKLRHVPLLMTIEMLKHEEHKKFVRNMVPLVVNRADEMAELLSLYWKNELVAIRDSKGAYVSQRAKKKVPMQLLRGIRQAFTKFDDYQLTKYLNKDKPVKMADVIRLVHPDPKEAQKNLPKYKSKVNMAEVYKSIVDGSARMPDETWEVALSAAGKSGKKEAFELLLDTNKLPAMALIRNLRGMIQAGVDINKMIDALDKMKVERILPFRFITSRNYAPQLSKQIETAMFKCIEGIEKLPGRTILLVDNSGSMTSKLANKSEMTNLDAAVGIAILAQKMSERSEILLFDDNTYKLEGGRFKMVNASGRNAYAYRNFYGSAYDNLAPTNLSNQYQTELNGFALADAIAVTPKGGTDIRQAVDYVNKNYAYDRLIIFTDEQSSTLPPAPTGKGYVINIASYKNGIGYGNWTHINGFSEGVLAYIAAYEKEFN